MTRCIDCGKKIETGRALCVPCLDACEEIEARIEAEVKEADRLETLRYQYCEGKGACLLADCPFPCPGCNTVSARLEAEDRNQALEDYLSERDKS